ncbi:MAG: hypothetical protein H8E44_47795 [Planctomycetes bacterium]|nr:hypothetical protein [Planctomycetota bacterium]MBL7043604.1 hypothetical protein [Pirellulaceae bacterium]
MTLKQKIDRELNRLMSEWAEGKTQRLDLETDSGRLACEITAVDALACSFDTIDFVSEQTADASIGQLREMAESLSVKLGYLLEPLDVIEVDEQWRIVQLRSRPPHRDDESIGYYELEIRPGQSRLRRYEKHPERPREAIPITVTREVFGRLAEDLCSVVS